MPDNMTAAQRSRTMSRIRREDTKPELAIRRLVHSRGLRYRKHVTALPGTPDMVFGSSRVVVFVDGCFWHGCPIHATWPQNNKEYWRRKIEGNKRRDRETDGRLVEEGWCVVRVWEHEDPEEAADRVVMAVRSRMGNLRS